MYIKSLLNDKNIQKKHLLNFMIQLKCLRDYYVLINNLIELSNVVTDQNHFQVTKNV